MENHNSTLIQGKHIKNYGKFIVLCVCKYYLNDITKNIHDKTKYETLKRVFNDLDYNKQINDIWDDVMKKLNITTQEDLLSIMFYIYEPIPNDLLYSTFTTFCGIRSLETETSWFDNIRLDGICSSHNLIMYNDFDDKDIYTVTRSSPKNDINESVGVSFKRVKELLVGELRTFIISNELYKVKRLPETFTIKDDKTICDECYKHYPFCYGGAHGWDILFNKNKSLSINEIYNLTKHYPSLIFGYIMNTQTYQSGKGEHWVSLCFKYRQCKMICSFGFDMFVFKPYFINKNPVHLITLLNNQGFGLNFNNVVIQKDNETCGMFSAISLYLMICYDMSITETIKKIGVNANDIIEGKNIHDFVKILAGQKINDNK